MAKPLVSDELWQRIEPLLPQPKPRRFRFPGASPSASPQGPHRHHLRPQDGHPLGGVAPGDGLRLWHDLPELPQCLAAGRGLGEVAPDPLGRGSSRPTSSIGPCAAVKSAEARALGGGDQTGPNPTDRGKPGTKHHVPTSGSRRAAGDPQHRGQRARRQRTAAAGRRHPAGAPEGGPPPRSPGQPVRRPGLRLTAASPGVGARGGSTPTCAVLDRTRQWPGGLSLGGGADLVVAAQLSQAPVADRSRGSGPLCLRLIGFSSHMYVVPMTRSFF